MIMIINEDNSLSYELYLMDISNNSICISHINGLYCDKGVYVESFYKELYKFIIRIKEALCGDYKELY